MDSLAKMLRLISFVCSSSLRIYSLYAFVDIFLWSFNMSFILIGMFALTALILNMEMFFKHEWVKTPL